MARALAYAHRVTTREGAPIDNPLKMLGATVLQRALLDLNGMARKNPAVGIDALIWLWGDGFGLEYWCSICGVSVESLRRRARHRAAALNLSAESKLRAVRLMQVH
jgi:hypothetical protein